MNGAVRAMRKEDVREIVNVHISAFPGFFLTFLGPAFLCELYRAIVADVTGIGFVYEYDGQIGGFVAGTADDSGFYGRLLRRKWWRFAAASVGAAIRQPTIIPRLLRALGKPRECPGNARTASLMSIAVAPDARRNGVGRRLVEAFVAEAEHRGAGWVSLTSDRRGNDGPNAFYRRLGFVCHRSFTTPEGREMNEYILGVPAVHLPSRAEGGKGA